MKLIDAILDRIHKSGINSLSPDQARFLKMSDAERSSEENKDFIEYLSVNEPHFAYDEYEYDSDENIFLDSAKTIRAIDKILGLKGSSSRDFAGAHVWKLKEYNNVGTGVFIYFDNSTDLVLVERVLDDETYIDNELSIVNDIKSFYLMMTKARHYCGSKLVFQR